MQYAICEDLFENVKKKLDRIARKCVKYGNGFVFEVKGNEIRRIRNENTGEYEYHKFIIIEVEGTAKVNDWEFIAAIDIHEDGNIIRRCNTDIEVPEHFRTSENVCEHCGTRRARNNLYIIHNVVTDEWKQVGGNCLALYTGGLDMEYVAAYMDGIAELEERNGVWGGGGECYYSVDEVIRYADIIINKIGYLKSGGDISTKSLVCTMLRRDVLAHKIETRLELVNKDLKAARFDVRFAYEDFFSDDAYNTVDKEVDNIISYYESLDDNSEFIHNIKTMLAMKYIPYRYIGYICYTPQGYAKHIEKEIERAERRKDVRAHWGEVGKRYKDVKIKHVERVATFETMYGYMNVYNITIEDGTVLTWKTSKDIEDNYDKITFTVKDHGEYKGVPQTEVTRCTIAYK